MKVKKESHFERADGNTPPSKKPTSDSLLVDLDPSTFAGEFIQRNRVIKEMIQNESNNIIYFKLLHSKFIVPLTTSVPALYQSDVDDLFTNWTELIQCSQAFFDEYSKIKIDNTQ